MRRILDGAALRDARIRAGLTQGQVCLLVRRAGLRITPGRLSGYEAGHYQMPCHFDVVIGALAMALGTTPDEITRTAPYIEKRERPRKEKGTGNP